jgi:hypothetical protein
MIHLILLALFLISCATTWRAVDRDYKGIEPFTGVRLARHRMVFWILMILNYISFWVWLIRMAVE